jgi:general stress protein YciG
MSGTVEGGIKAAQANKARYGKGFYKRIGAIGGIKSRGGGFAADPELARLAGKLGGLIGTRSKTKRELTVDQMNRVIELKRQIAKLKENAR